MISVHAISMIYELRALRSRLVDMLTRDAGIFDTRTDKELSYMLSLTENMIAKVERTGEFIATLEDIAEAYERSQEEARLGAQQRGDDLRSGGAVHPASE